MLARRKAIQPVPPPRKKRKSASAIEEITFDFNDREEYLTGFHKRKLQRIKHAKQEAAKKEREDKIAARKIVCANLLFSPFALSNDTVTATRRTEGRPGEAC